MDLFTWTPPPAKPGYPDAPGHKERHGTSERAAQAMAPKAGTLRAMALAALRAAPGGLTADEIAEACGVDILSMRPRVSELYRLGLVEKTTRERLNRSTKAARVWRVK